jgi:hypothetical protein
MTLRRQGCIQWSATAGFDAAQWQSGCLTSSGNGRRRGGQLTADAVPAVPVRVKLQTCSICSAHSSRGRGAGAANGGRRRNNDRRHERIDQLCLDCRARRGQLISRCKERRSAERPPSLAVRCPFPRADACSRSATDGCCCQTPGGNVFRNLVGVVWDASGKRRHDTPEQPPCWLLGRVNASLPEGVRQPRGQLARWVHGDLVCGNNAFKIRGECVA